MNATGKRVLSGRSGVIYTRAGRIIFAHAPVKGIDTALLSLLEQVVDSQQLCLSISSVDTGKHAINSRHYQGRAVDISLIGDAQGMLLPVTVHNQVAVRLVKLLLSSGFHVGEGRPWPAVLFGPVHTEWNSTEIPHNDHMHVSLPRPKGLKG